MSGKQVFLSYSLEDTDTARHLVNAIEARGWPISWERYEAPDAIMTLALRQALTVSDCVVVLWSKHSVDSPSIREEASHARTRGALVQGALDDAAIPMPFILDEPTPLTDKWSVTTLVQQIARVLHDDVSTLDRESEERDPDSEVGLEARMLELAEEHADAGQLTQAIATYERWVGAKPNDMKAVRRLGDLYLASDRTSDAAARYEQVAEHYAASGFLIPAIETFRRIVELAPESDAYRARLDALSEQKQLETTGAQRAMSSVQFTLTAPPSVKAGESFSIDVWAHGHADHHEISRRLADAASATGLDTAGTVAGPALTARAHIDGLETDSSEQSLSWDRGLGCGSCLVRTSADTVKGGRTGVIGVYFLGLQIARIHFLVHVGDTTTKRELIPSRQERHTRAIASYALEDRDAVAARIRAFEKAAPGIDVSLAPIELRGRDDSRSAFLDHISAGDVLYLFWSENASHSQDVEQEWRYALRLRGIDFIDPVPLDATAPPPELATLHEGNWHHGPTPLPQKGPLALDPN